MIIHIPHSSYYIPEFLRSDILLSESELEENLFAFTDWKTDDLFSHGSFSNRVVYPVSRMVCDPERFRSDEDEPMAARGIGAVYTQDAFLRPLRKVDKVKRELMLRMYYDTHHKRLTSAVEREIRQFGKCLLIDAHSFSGTPLPYEFQQSPDRPDFCIGTLELHTPQTLIVKAVNFLESSGFSVSLNVPYSGTMVPLKYYGDPRVNSIMIEINRKLYASGWKKVSPNYQKIKNVIGQLLHVLS